MTERRGRRSQADLDDQAGDRPARRWKRRCRAREPSRFGAGVVLLTGGGAAARGSQAEARLADEVARYEEWRPVGAGLPDWMYPTMDTLQWVISGLFLLEYACRIWAAERRLQYLSRSPEQ